MTDNPRVEFIQIDYPSLVSDPEKVVPEIAEFLGDKLNNPEGLYEPIDGTLYRNRSTS